MNSGHTLCPQCGYDTISSDMSKPELCSDCDTPKPSTIHEQDGWEVRVAHDADGGECEIYGPQGSWTLVLSPLISGMDTLTDREWIPAHIRNWVAAYQRQTLDQQ